MKINNDLSINSIDLFDSAEGLSQLLKGFETKTTLRIEEWNAEPDIVNNLQTLLEEAKWLHRVLATMLAGEETDFSLDEVQERFIRVLRAVDSLSREFESRARSVGRFI